MSTVWMLTDEVGGPIATCCPKTYPSGPTVEELELSFPEEILDRAFLVEMELVEKSRKKIRPASCGWDMWNAYFARVIVLWERNEIW